MRLNLAVVGFYYFKNGEDLIAAIDQQIEQGIRTKGEYFLADAIKLMLNNGAQVRAEMVDVWLDAGLPETVLETNQYLLEHGRDNTNSAKRRNRMTVIPLSISILVQKSSNPPSAPTSPLAKVVESMVLSFVIPF